jgi:porin
VFSTRDDFAVTVAPLAAAYALVSNRFDRAPVAATFAIVGLLGIAGVCSAAENFSILRAPTLLPRPRMLADRGLDIDVYYNHFYAAVIDGGTPSPEEEPHSGSVDLFARLDLDRAVGLPASQLLLQVKTHYHKSVNPKVRALSDPVDDADGNSWFYVDQLWYEQGLLDRRLRLRLGYLDEQVIVDRNAYANSEDKQFSSTFLDNNPTIPLAIGLGGAVEAEPFDWLTLIFSFADAENHIRSAGFDSAFDDWRGYVIYLESDFEVSLPGPKGWLPGTYRVGFLRDPRKRREFGTGVDAENPIEKKREDFGGYFNFDQMLYREHVGSDSGLGVFGRYGYREPDVNKITQFVSAGLQYRGLIPRRDEDVLGLAMYAAYVSDDYDDEQPEDLDREFGVEVYYSVQVTPWLAVTPDFQFIDAPGGRSYSSDVWLFVLRGRVAL